MGSRAPPGPAVLTGRWRGGRAGGSRRDLGPCGTFAQTAGPRGWRDLRLFDLDVTTGQGEFVRSMRTSCALTVDPGLDVGERARGVLTQKGVALWF